MAHREDIMDRVRKINPWAADFIEETDKMMGLSADDHVIITEDMTPEEEKMAHIEYFMKKGHSYEEAERLAEAHNIKILTSEIVYDLIKTMFVKRCRYILDQMNL